MKIEKMILEKLVKGEEFPIAGGELVVKTKLSKVVAGINVYGIVLERNGSDTTDTTNPSFDSVEQLMEYAKGNDDGTSLHICAECEGIPTESGYYINNETGEEFCCYNCLMNSLNRKYGYTWNTMLGDTDKFEVWLRISREDADDLEDYKKINGEYWRKLDIEFISPFEKYHNLDDIFGESNLEEIDDVLL